MIELPEGQDVKGALTAPPVPDIWKDFLQLALASSGAVAATLYVVGWLYWRAYLHYFGVPSAAVHLTYVESASASVHGSVPLIVLMMLAPGLIVSRRVVRTAQYSLSRFRLDVEKYDNDLETISALLDDLRKRAASTTDPGEVAKLDHEITALNSLVDENRRNWEEVKARKLPKWIATLGDSLDTGHAWKWVVGGGVFGETPLLIVLSYHDTGTKSLRVEVPLAILVSSITVLAWVFLIETAWRRRFSTLAVVTLISLIVAVPVTASFDGYAAAYRDWNSDNSRPFTLVTMYSTTRLADDWNQLNNIYVSPPTYLVTQTSAAYVILPSLNAKGASVVPSGEIIRVDYIQ